MRAVVVGLALAGLLATAGFAQAVDPAEIPRLEKRIDRFPSSFKTHMALGRAYWSRARTALDDERLEAYQADAERAVREWVFAARIDPEDPDPHTMMAVAARYQGRLDDAIDGLANARRLEPRRWVAYSNLAKALIYRGNVSGAEKFLERAKAMGAPPSEVQLDWALLEWKYGKLVEANWHFGEALRLQPNVVRTFDGARTPWPLDSLEAFTRYCCSVSGCGPYMVNACALARQDVIELTMPAELVRRERVAEMNRRRLLLEVYEQRRDLKVEIDSPEAALKDDVETPNEPSAESAPPDREPAGPGPLLDGPL